LWLARLVPFGGICLGDVRRPLPTCFTLQLACWPLPQSQGLFERAPSPVEQGSKAKRGEGLTWGRQVWHEGEGSGK